MLFIILGYPAIAGLYVLTAISIFYSMRAKSYDMNKLTEMPQRTVILDRKGNEIARMHGEKRDIITLDQVSPYFKKAIIAREDERFYDHGAFDVIGIGRATLANLRGKREGASTITQQLASDVFQLKKYGVRQNIFQQIDRKMLEIFLGMRIESHLGSKDKVLETYLNSINWGRSIRGIQEASRVYFEKNASELDLSESATLAGIVRGPDAYNPFHDITAAIRERNSTFERMITAKMATRDEVSEAKALALPLRPMSRRMAQESYAVSAIRSELEKILEKENFDVGGLEIHTTIDSNIQTKAEEAINSHLTKIEKSSNYSNQTRAQWQAIPDNKKPNTSYLQGAAVVIENRTGEVLAIVGGRDANESKFNRATQAKRQVGSIFKPFVYLAAFDKGLTPDSKISDGWIGRGEIKNAPRNWHPQNSDGKYYGMMPASYGLIKSRNTMSVRVGDYAGMNNVIEVGINAFNIEPPKNPASYLGTWEATPYQVASAYSLLPNGGVRCRPFFISLIKKRDAKPDEEPLYKSGAISFRAANPKSSWQISNILQEVTEIGTAASIKKLGFDKPCGGKTGTTNDFRDAWFAGYTSSVTCSVWCGLDEPKKIMPGAYGASIALPIWVEIMKTTERLGYKATKFSIVKQDIADEQSDSLISVDLCKSSGKRATPSCHDAGTTYTDNMPSKLAPEQGLYCDIHPYKAIPIEDEDTVAASEDAPPPTREEPLRAIPIEEETPRKAIRVAPSFPNNIPRAEPVEE